jgi:hypothetical protein
MNTSSVLEMTDFEENLHRHLAQVPPNPDFVNRLNQRLLTEKKVYIEPATVSYDRLLIVLGFILGVGFLVMIFKMIFSKSKPA